MVIVLAARRVWHIQQEGKILGIEVSQSDTETYIFGSGFGAYPWWLSVTNDWEYDACVHAPDGWVWHVTVDSRTGDGEVTKDIDHEALTRAFYVIAGGGGGRYVSQRCREECANVFVDAGSVDFDAETADEVVQVAVFGEVHYG